MEVIALQQTIEDAHPYKFINKIFIAMKISIIRSQSTMGTEGVLVNVRGQF